MIKRGKDSITKNEKSSVIYKIECKDCKKVYIGQTQRHLEKIIKEHKNNINKDIPTAIEEHVKDKNHIMIWDKVEILDTEKHYYERLTSEMIFIKKHSEGSLNK